MILENTMMRRRREVDCLPQTMTQAKIATRRRGEVVDPTKLLQKLSLLSQKLMICHRVVREFPVLKRFLGI